MHRAGWREPAMSLRAYGGAALLLVTACTFPDVDITITDGSAGGTTPGVGGAGGASGGGGSTGTAMTSGFGGAALCDDDTDGAWVKSAQCCQTRGECDCDDEEPIVKPSQQSYFPDPRPGFTSEEPLAFDYNCDGVIEKEFPEGGCPMPCDLDSGKRNFLPAEPGNYECGAEGRLWSCSGSMCANDTTYRLGCR